MSDVANGFELARSWYHSGTFPNFAEHHCDDTWPEPGSTYVWCAMFIDHDWEWAALLRVDTTVMAERHLEVVDWLGVWGGGGDVTEVEWRQDPRLFFDQTANWVEDGRDWLVHQDAERGRYKSDDPLPSHHQHNVDTSRRDREHARAAGIVLPYLNNMDRPCLRCGLLLHLEDETDWFDDNMESMCPGGSRLPHFPG